MLSARRLFLVFLIFCGVFLVLTFPPAMVFSVTGAGKSATYRQLEGSILHTKFEGLAIAGTYLGDGYFDPNLSDLLSGSFGGTLMFSDGLQQGSMTFHMRNDNQMDISQFKTASRAAVQTPFGELAGDVYLEVSNMALSLSKGCSGGEVMVQTSVFNDVLENLDFMDFPFEGTGSCDRDGVVRVHFDAEQQDIGFFVEVILQSRQAWAQPQAQITVSVSSKKSKQLPQALISKLTAIGMQPNGDGYAIEFPARLSGATGGYQ